MTLNEDAFDVIRPIIKRASKSVGFQWPGVAESDDLEQDIFMRLLESPGSVEKIIAMEDNARYRAIVGIGHQLASIERDDYDLFSSNFKYSVGDVKSLLAEGVLEGRQTQSGWDTSDDVAPSAAEPEGLVRSSEIDLQAGLRSLDGTAPQYSKVIRSRYSNDWETPAQGSPEKDSLSRGLAALTDEMNRNFKRRRATRDDGPGTRRSISNAAAYARSAQQYSGAYNEERY